MGIRHFFYIIFFSILFCNVLLVYGSFTTQESQITNETSIPAVVVSAKKSSFSLSSGPKALITHQQLQETGVTTLAQALQNLAGAQLQDLSGTGSQVLLSLRGFGANASSNTLLLVNGIPLTNPDLAPPDLNAIPINEIESIEVIAGSESVLYGDQAVGGAINVLTRRHSAEKVSLFCRTGSYNQYGCDLHFYHAYHHLSAGITLLKNQTDNYRDHNHYDEERAIGNIALAYPQGQLNLDYNLAKVAMQYPGALTAEEVRENRQQAANDTDFFDNWNGLVHVNHQQFLSPFWKLETDFALRRMQGDGVLFSPFTQSRSLFFLKPQIKGKIGQKNITAGLDFQNDCYDLNSAFGLTDEKQQKYSLFALANMPIAAKTTFSIGARGAKQQSHLESFTSSDTLNRAFASTIGLTYALKPDTNIYLRRAESFRFPKADENAFAPIGVKSLRTQRGVAYETGIEANRDTYSARLGLYELNLRDEIAFDPMQTPQQPFGSNRNLAPTIRRGFTLSGRNQITAKWAIDGQYNYVNARFQTGLNDGNRIPLVSENLFRAGVQYRLNAYLDLYAQVIYTGNQYPANDDTNTGGLIGGYTIYDVNLRYEHKPFSVAFHINNIFNKNYYLYTVQQGSSEFFYPAPERNFTLTVNYFMT